MHQPPLPPALLARIAAPLVLQRRFVTRTRSFTKEDFDSLLEHNDGLFYSGCCRRNPYQPCTQAAGISLCTAL